MDHVRRIDMHIGRLVEGKQHHPGYGNLRSAKPQRIGQNIVWLFCYELPSNTTHTIPFYFHPEEKIYKLPGKIRGVAEREPMMTTMSAKAAYDHFYRRVLEIPRHRFLEAQENQKTYEN